MIRARVLREGPFPSARTVVLCLAAITVLFGARDAAADGPEPPAGPALEALHLSPPLVWEPGWKAFGAGDYVVTGAGVAVAIAGAAIPPLPRHLQGGILFDDAVRNALEIRPTNIGARYVARDTSDVLLSLAATSPFFFDAMFTAWYQRRSPEVAEQMALIDAEAFAIAGAAQEMTTALTSRERPYAADCGGALPSTTLDCTNPGRYRSFFSGHATLSFTAAGLTCEHHLTLGLLGGVEDALVCGGALVLAATTATLRVVSDQHYASDVIAGALVGTAIGLGVPALHYSGGRPRNPRTGWLDVRLVPTGLGATVIGVFR